MIRAQNENSLFTLFFSAVSIFIIIAVLYRYWFCTKIYVKRIFTYILHFMILIVLLGSLKYMKLNNMIRDYILLEIVFFSLMIIFKYTFKQIKFIFKFFDKKIKYKKMNFYTIWYSSFLVIMLEVIFIPNLNEIFMLIETASLALLLAILFPIPSKIGIKIDFLNLDYDKMFQNQIFIISNVIRDYRVFKFNLDKMFPSNAEKREVYLKHRFNIKPKIEAKTTAEEEINTEGSFYYAVGEQIISEQLKIILKYNVKRKMKIWKRNNEKEKTKYVKLKMYINKKIENGEIIITDYLITQCFEIRMFMFIRNYFKNRLMESEFDFHNYSRLLKKAYKYNILLDQKSNYYQIESSYNDNKWMFHDDDYGTGKTTLDYLYTSNAGYHPIHISPWEANYDDDILYLIYDKVQPSPSYPRKSTSIFFLIITAAIWKFCIKDINEFLWNVLRIIYKKADWIQPYLDTLYIEINESLGFQNVQFIFEFCMLFLALLCAYKCLPRAIIHFKKSTKVHQEYYITGIVNAINLKNIFLIIEDVDRLSVETLDQLFRVCSSISKHVVVKNRAIGLLSFSKANLKHTYEEYYSQKGRKFDFDKYFSNIENKLFHKKVFQDYSSQKSMMMYLKDTVQTIISLPDTKIENKEDINGYLETLKAEVDTGKRKIKKNFRDIQKCIGDIMDMDEFDCDSIKTKVNDLFDEK